MNPSTFVVIGDGLAAGAGDFGLSEDLQPFSFPARIAQRLNVTFSQPIMEAPGIGPVIGFPELPVRLPQAMQTTVLKEFPPAGPFANLSIPGLKLADALSRRPTVPVIDRGPYVSGRQWDLSRGLCDYLDHCYTGAIEWRWGGR